MCLATPRHRPRWPTPRHRALHAPLGAAAFGIATLASLRSPQRGVQRKAKAFYRTEFTPPFKAYVNAKNTFGGYTGAQEHEFILVDNKVIMLSYAGNVKGTTIIVTGKNGYL